MDDQAATATFLFTDIEGSTRLWEQEPERMRPAMARHDALAREAVHKHRGHVVKMTGDGLHAAFGDPLDALAASVELQIALAQLEATSGLALRARCGLHAGAFERRDNDYYGTAVNRAARIMSAAHGGQVLVSQAVAEQLAARLPAQTSLRDLGSARLRDLASSERLFQVVHPRLRADFPALRALDETPNNLPHSLASFVGREREISEIGELLASRRLVTVTGMGGLGKTRLTLEVAARLRDRYPDGVWFVELAPLADAQWVEQAVASVLGVKPDAGRPVVEALAAHLEDRDVLLILDNCEHLIEACATLAERLLGAAPKLVVLASSREPLRVSGEVTYPLSPLSISDEAVQLFIHRARSALPAFEVTEGNAAAVSAICRRLDGIPLALELAAARVRTLPVQKIAERLDNRFELLTGGERTALPRQQTLRALIDWSNDLLTLPERALFHALAVFSGTWSLEAAEAVVPASAGDEAVVDLLGRLVEKSLVLLDPESGRYRFLETVREYAREQLDASGRGQAVGERHLAYYVEFAETAKPQLVGPDQAAWLARLDLERENILAAHACAGRGSQDAGLGLRLLSSVKHYWINRGLLELGYRVTMEALARPGAQERTPTRMRGLYEAGQLRLLMGHYGDARSALEESLAAARELRDERAIAAVLQPLGMASLGQGELATARGYLEEALALARMRGNRRELGAALTALAQLHRVDGRVAEAQRLCEEALALARDLDDRESVAIGLLNLAMVSLLQDRGDRVDAMLLEALEIAQELRSRRVTQSLLEACAGFASHNGDWEPAVRLFGAAEAQAGDTGLRRDPADEAFLAPRIEAARRALDPVRYSALESAGRAIEYEEALAEARAWLGRRPPVPGPRRSPVPTSH